MSKSKFAPKSFNDALEVGETADYAQRRVNSTGEVSPWGVVTGDLAT